MGEEAAVLESCRKAKPKANFTGSLSATDSSLWWCDAPDVMAMKPVL